MAAYDRIFNFSAGPSMLPLPALERAAKEMMNYGGSGMSVMEMSHRSKAFQQIFDDTQAKLRRLISENADADYILWNGNRPQIKRRLFEKYIDCCGAI